MSLFLQTIPSVIDVVDILKILQKLGVWYSTGSTDMKMQHYTQRIIIDPKILAGKPVIKGTRISVELVLKRLSQDLDMQTIFEAYPHLTEEDIKACFAYGSEDLEPRPMRQ
jgi:uncharacterized protein (DUF433 family)